MRISLFSSREAAELRRVWQTALAQFSWEEDVALASAMYSAVPLPESLSFVADGPSRGGRLWLAVPEPRPDPEMVCEELATHQVTIFPPNFAWAISFVSGAEEGIRFGFPCVPRAPSV